MGPQFNRVEGYLKIPLALKSHSNPSTFTLKAPPTRESVCEGVDVDRVASMDYLVRYSRRLAPPK